MVDLFNQLPNDITTPDRKKNKSNIARLVQKRLIENERVKEKPRKVYSVDYIRKEILREVWPEIL